MTAVLTQAPCADLRLGVVCDLAEENWPSMDLVGDMLVAHLAGTSLGVDAGRIRPAMLRRFTGFTRDGLDSSKLLFNADRFLNRFWDYPRFLRRSRAAFDVFHVVDHSYAQLVLELPAERTLVTCHDLDTFTCLLEPEREPRSPIFQAMIRKTLRGLQAAALVVCPTKATRDQLLEHKLIPEERLRVLPWGAHPTCSPESDEAADTQAARLLGERDADGIDLLHVSSTMQRKRIDVLLRVFAEVRKRYPRTRLIRVGGPFTPAQEALVDELRLANSIVVLPPLDRNVLAAVYRRAAIVLLTSEREGFGLPVLEAMACGTPVVATGIPSVREVGAGSTSYCGLEDIEGWLEAISGLLEERRQDPSRWQRRREEALTAAHRFTWNHHTREMVKFYREIAGKNIAKEFAS